MYKYILSLLLAVLGHSSLLYAENHLVVLGESEGSHLTVDLLGGAFVDFRMSEKQDNPLSWGMAADEMPENNRQGACFHGHFMCLGRWGAPTAGEIKAGIPHNGEAGNKLWDLREMQGDSLLIIATDAPRDGVSAKRVIQFDKANSIFKVVDNVNSLLSVGRLFNVVQHVTLGSPFLTTSTIINSNATYGFMQHLAYPDPHLYEYKWPYAILDTLGNKIDLTQTSDPVSYVSTHLFEDEYGWVVAFDSKKNTLVGYIWRTKDYPWINVWQEMKEGRPYAKGLEFGTTGIGLPYQDLLAIDTRFHGVNSFFYLDALEHIQKVFIGFQTAIPSTYAGVADIRLEEKRIVLVEKNSGREIIINHHYNL